MKKHLWFWGAALVVGGSLLFLTRFVEAADVRVKIQLTVDPAILAANPAARATAEFRSRPGRTRLSLDVAAMAGLAGQVLNVSYSAGPTTPSSMTVGVLGAAGLEADGVAAATTGTTVVITKAIDGSTVATGSF